MISNREEEDSLEKSNLTSLTGHPFESVPALTLAGDDVTIALFVLGNEGGDIYI